MGGPWEPVSVRRLTGDPDAEDDPGCMRARTALAWVIVAAIGATTAVYYVLYLGAGGYRADWTEEALYTCVVLVCMGVGLLLAVRRPVNPIGWVLLANAFLIVLSGIAEAYPGYALEHEGSYPGARLAAAWNTWGWPALFAPLVAIALIFPDGRLPSPRWRPVAIGGAISFVLVVVTGMLWDEPLDAPYESFAPYAVLPDAVAEVAHTLALLGMIATLVLAMTALVSRFRSATGVLRLQLKWIAYAGTLLPIAIVAGTVEGVALDRDPGLITELPFALLQAAVPVAIGIAVLRYRLYEIERLINATLVYGALTAILAVAFASVSLGMGVALGGGSALPTAAATLAVAIAFRPVRDRVQRAVDRRFNRPRYEALERVEEFLADLRGGRAEPELIGSVLARATGDARLELFFWLPNEELHADARGGLVRALPETPAGRTPVRRGELRLGTVVHDPALDRPGSPLGAVIVRAGLAIEIARLRVEVRRRLAEVEQSRARIVTVTYEERRRLERDIHDGAQQRLVSIGLDLRHLQRELEPPARAGLDSIVARLADAIAELRELARGVRPAALDGGLAPALRELASRASIPTEIEVTEERFGEQIEAAAYFVASEALTNAVKHARPSSVALRAAVVDSRLVISVDDDGCGGAVLVPGSGLSGLADRVSALGGRIDVRSNGGGGTSIVAELPCG
jgi:signal transduction histidine kinase